MLLVFVLWLGLCVCVCVCVLVWLEPHVVLGLPNYFQLNHWPPPRWPHTLGSLSLRSLIQHPVQCFPPVPGSRPPRPPCRHGESAFDGPVGGIGWLLVRMKVLWGAARAEWQGLEPRPGRTPSKSCIGNWPRGTRFCPTSGTLGRLEKHVCKFKCAMQWK